MTRDEAAQYLSAEFASMWAKTGVLDVDHATGYGTVIDAALRALEAPEPLSSAEITGAEVVQYYALLRYFALKRFLLNLSMLVDTTIDGVPINRSQLFRNISALLADAKEEVAALGFIPTAGGFELGSINLDYLEPAAGF